MIVRRGTLLAVMPAPIKPVYVLVAFLMAVIVPTTAMIGPDNKANYRREERNHYYAQVHGKYTHGLSSIDASPP